MARFQLTWIDKDAELGPLFRIGPKDVYYRERPGRRVVRLKAVHSPDMSYVAPALEAFRELAGRWGCPVVFVIDPDVRKPPAARFLYEWSHAAFQNGSVDQSFMVMRGGVGHILGRFVCRMFCEGGMPFEAIRGEEELARRLDALDTSTGWPGWSLPPASTALVPRRHVGEGPYVQLLVRLLRRLLPRRQRGS